MNFRFHSTLAAIVVVCALAAFGEEPFSFETTPGHLPKDIVPKRYAIRVEPSLEKGSFRGNVEIDINVRKPVRQIVLHAKELTIEKAHLAGSEALLEPKLDPAAETLTLSVPKELPVGAARLVIEFSGKLSERPQGLYITRYPTAQGEQRALITQFEATDARRMFPCWDEPVFRATFQLTVVFPAKDNAVSNMPIEHEQARADGLKEVAFAETPSMPSYLLALCTGKFEVIEDEIDGIKLRVFTTEGKREQGRYAMEATKLILPYFNEYFGVKYPLPKLDQLSFASTAAGGMENWGCIIYTDTALLYDPATSSQSTKERVFEVIAHEIAHQWFGDYVTMAWWDNLWLNEGFASWMGTKATDHFNPEWKSWLRAADEKEWAMRLDARLTTHPIQQPITRESQVNDIFDAITYSKGQAFLRMLETWLGEEPFRDGLRIYMKRHAYSNATTADLWAALSQASRKPVAKMAAEWTEQPGFPMVNATLEGTELHLDQERFTVNQKDFKPLMWSIPIATGWPSETESGPLLFLQNKSAAFPIPGLKNGVIKLNWGDTGYYRTAYGSGLFARLVAEILDLPEADRLNLVNDTWAMVTAGRESMQTYLNLIQNLEGETSYVVVHKIVATLGEIDFLARETQDRELFQQWAVKYLRPQLQRLGTTPKPNESPLDSLLRASLISTLGKFGDDAVIRDSRQRFQAFLVDPSTLTGDLRSAFLFVVGRHADDDTYEALHRLARAETSTEEKRRLYGALAASLDPKHAGWTLALSITNELPPQGATKLVQAVGDDGEQPAAAWDFGRKHLETLTALLPSIRSYGYAPSLFTSFTDEARAEELAAFAREHLPPEAEYEVAKAIDEVRFKAEMKKRVLPEITAWCRAHL